MDDVHPLKASRGTSATRRSRVRLPPSGSTWIRTRDLPVMSRTLSPLSYGPGRAPVAAARQYIEPPRAGVSSSGAARPEGTRSRRGERQGRRGLRRIVHRPAAAHPLPALQGELAARRAPASGGVASKPARSRSKSGRRALPVRRARGRCRRLGEARRGSTPAPAARSATPRGAGSPPRRARTGSCRSPGRARRGRAGGAGRKRLGAAAGGASPPAASTSVAQSRAVATRCAGGGASRRPKPRGSLTSSGTSISSPRRGCRRAGSARARRSPRRGSAVTTRSVRSHWPLRSQRREEPPQPLVGRRRR